MVLGSRAASAWKVATAPMVLSERSTTRARMARNERQAQDTRRPGYDKAAIPWVRARASATEPQTPKGGELERERMTVMSAMICPTRDS